MSRTKASGSSLVDRRRLLRGVGTFVALGAAMALPAGSMRIAASERPERLEITARPITAFQPSRPDRVRFGALDFRGGLVLSSPHRDFGGVSGFRLEASGERFLAVSDRGMWLKGRLRYSGKVPTAIEEAEIAPLLGDDGRPVTVRRNGHDAEALAIDGDIAHVAFERIHRILRYATGRDGLAARGTAIRTPPEFSRLPWNQGIEALAVVPRDRRPALPHAGRMIAISERSLDKAGNIRGFILGGGQPAQFAVQRTDDFDITDADILPGGGLIILERHFSRTRGVAMRLRVLDLGDLGTRKPVTGRELFTADFGYEIDNMEAISVHRDSEGATVITLVSDDNFSFLQRTILLQFTLAD